MDDFKKVAIETMLIWKDEEKLREAWPTVAAGAALAPISPTAGAAVIAAGPVSRAVRSIWDQCIRKCGITKGFFSRVQQTGRRMCVFNCRIQAKMAEIQQLRTLTGKCGGDQKCILKLQARIAKASSEMAQLKTKLADMAASRKGIKATQRGATGPVR